jgi:hypothetical protein
VLLVVLAALVAGCGGGGSTTVIERTVTEKVEAPPKGGGQASFVCAGDTALEPGLASLSYGTAARVGGSECISRDDGVTCVNQAGHGFFISVQSYQVF